MKTQMTKMLHKAMMMLRMPTVKERLTMEMEMELWSMKTVVRATAKGHLSKAILPQAMTTVDGRVSSPLHNMDLVETVMHS